MIEVNLTKDSKELLAIIYKEYLDKINNGISKSEAKKIGHVENVCKLVPDWLTSDVVETMQELKRKGFLDYQLSGNTIYYSRITDELIIYMETKVPRTVKNVLEIISRLK